MENLQKSLKKMENDIRALETDLNNSRVQQSPDDLFNENMSVSFKKKLSIVAQEFGSLL